MEWIEWQKIIPLQLCWNKLPCLQEINYTVFQKMFFDSFPDHPHPLRNYAPEQLSPHFTGRVTTTATAADLIWSRLYISFPCEAAASGLRHWDPVRLRHLYVRKQLSHYLPCLYWKNQLSSVLVPLKSVSRSAQCLSTHCVILLEIPEILGSETLVVTSYLITT